jgi:uncharacterized protein YndB with AHSA1/START domain
MTSTTTTADAVGTTIQVYRVYIKASAEQIWQAITDPEWSQRYGYGGFVHYDLKPGGKLEVNPDETMKAASAEMGWPLPDVIIDGEVIEADAPRKLVTTWRMLMDPGTTADGFTTLTYEIREQDGGFCSLTVAHDVTGAPAVAALVQGNDGPAEAGGGGHPWILSDLKSLLETGAGLAG